MIVDKILINSVIPAFIKKYLAKNRYHIKLEGEKWEALSDFLRFVFDPSNEESIDAKDFESKILANEIIYYGFFVFKMITKEALQNLDFVLNRPDLEKCSDPEGYYAIELTVHTTYVTKQDLICLLNLGQDLYLASNDEEAGKVIQSYLQLNNIEQLVEHTLQDIIPLPFYPLEQAIEHLFNNLKITDAIDPVAHAGTITVKRKMVFSLLIEMNLLELEKVQKVFSMAEIKQYKNTVPYLKAIEQLLLYYDSTTRSERLNVVPTSTSILEQKISLEWFLNDNTPVGYEAFEWLALVEKILIKAKPTGAGEIYSKIDNKKVVLTLEYEDGLHFRVVKAVLEGAISDYLIYKTAEYIKEKLKQAQIKHELSSFPSGAVMIDIWKGEDFYVVQMDGKGIGLSVVDGDEFSSIPDKQYYDFEEFKIDFEELL